MKLTRKQRSAIAAARRIRANLVRLRRDTDLGGDCGLASAMLAAAIGVDSLRHTSAEVNVLGDQWSLTHVWNEIDGLIIDITATQFNDGFGEPDPSVNLSLVRGVLITTEPRFYHRPVTGRGSATLKFASDALLETNSYRPVRRLIARLEAA